MKFRILTFLLIFATSGAFAQITIQAARNLGVGATVTVNGVVLNGSELGSIRYIQDATAGIAAYSNALSGVNRGDSITITGVIKDYNALLEIDPVSSHTVISTGVSLPTPEVIIPDSLNEAREAELVRINNVTFTTNPGGTFSSNTAYNFTANGQTSSIYVRSNHPLIGQIVPSGAVDIVGICSQYSYSSPTAGYQLLCRDSSDIISSNSIAVVSPISLSNLTQTTFDLSWTTNMAGTSEVYYGSDESLGNHAAGTGTSTNHTYSFTSLSASELVYVRAFSVDGGDTAFAPIKPFITESASSGDIKVYFNSTVDHSVSSGTNAVVLPNAIDDTLIAYINRAQLSIDFTIYNFNPQNISNVATALNNAHANGVTVRVIFDGSANNIGIQSIDPGIKKIASPIASAYGIMHNKFMVFDAADVNNAIVWTGSTNLTDGQVNTDPNNVIIIQDKSLAIAYTIEFNEMFGSTTAIPNNSNAKFGPDKTDNTPHNFKINGMDVELYFSPSDGTNDKIISTIESASDNIRIATMLITRSDIAYALQDAVNNNSVDLKVLVNHENDCSSTVWGILSALLDTNLRDDQGMPGIMHHKFMVVDEGAFSDPILLVGCHNWSNAANNKNDENTLVIHSAALANIYYQAFSQRFKENGSVGIKYNEFSTEVNVYPNPTTDQINIDFTSENSGAAQIIIYDLSGRKVYSKNHNLSGNNNINISASSFTKGTYVLHIQSEGANFVQTIVVQ